MVEEPLELVIGEGRLRHTGGLLAAGSEAVEDDGEVPLPELVAKLGGLGRDRAEHGAHDGDVGGGDVGPELSGGLGGFDEVGDEGQDLASGVLDPLVAGVAAGHQLGETPVGDLEAKRFSYEADQSFPRVGHCGGGAGHGSDLFDALPEKGVDELLLVGEASVDGADPDIGSGGNVVEGDLEAFGREDPGSGGEDPEAVGFGVAA
jgi:hypothetical protein